MASFAHIRTIGFSFAWLLISAWTIFGAPSSTENFTVTQDGAQWTLSQKGDEYLHWHETSDGYPVGLNASGNWEVLKPSGNLSFQLTGSELRSGLSLAGNVKAPFFASANLRALKIQRWSKTKSLPTLLATGTKKQLVILAYFKDHSSGNQVLPSMVVGAEDGSPYKTRFTTGTNSVHAYFEGVSRGKLKINTQVTPWLALPKTEAEYGFDNSGNTDLGLEDLVKDAILMASSNTTTSTLIENGGVNYDWVTIIHSGRDQARATASSNTNHIWSTSGNLVTPVSLYGGNVQFQRYVVSSALGGKDEMEAGDAGVISHEIGHLLGLPDLMEYQESGYGIGTWGLMGHGAWGMSGNGLAKSSVGTMSAWSKITLGWETPTILDVSGNHIGLDSIQSSGEIYKLPTSVSNEYFLIEGRGPSLETWSDMPSSWGKGLLIWHVDEKAWGSLAVSDFAHPLLKLEEADGDDSIGSRLSLAEKSDMWSGNSILKSFSGNALKTGSSKLYGSTAYYDRTSLGQSSHYLINNFIESTTIKFDLLGPRSRLSIKNFAGGELSWQPAEGATSYELERRITSTGSFSKVFSGNTLSFVDVTIPGNVVDYDYQVRAIAGSEVLGYSSVMHFGLLLDSASFDAHQGLLTLNWNLPVSVFSSSTLNLSGMRIKNISGNLIFSLSGGNLASYAYPAKQTSDVVDSFYTINTTEQTIVPVRLSDVQRYEYIQNSGVQNDNLYLELDADVARSFVSGNVANPAQSHALGNAVKVSGQKDTTPPAVVSIAYSHDNGELTLGYNEPLYMTTLSYSGFEIYGLNGSPNSTDLTGATFTVHGNVLTITLSGDRRVRAAFIQNQNAGQLRVRTPSSQILDLSTTASVAADISSVTESPDITAPKIKSFSMNLRDEVRQATIEFSEPVFFPRVLNGREFGITLGSTQSFQTLYSGNAIGEFDANPTLLQTSDASFSIVSTTGVILDLTESEVNQIDTLYGLFANPAPDAHARLSDLSEFYDYQHSLSFNTRNVNTTTVTSSANYIPRRRARLIHPHYSPSVTIPLSQESLIWKWHHRVAFEVNGGWSGNELLRVDWENAQLSGNGIIAQNISLLGNLTTGLMDSEQYLIWETHAELDSTGYRLKVQRQDKQTLYDLSPSLVEIDNTSPQVKLSYISNSTPSTKVNANAVVASELYDFPLTADERLKTNVIVVATYTEPVIKAPHLFLNQAGALDISTAMRSASGNTVDSVFFYPYDVITQDDGDHADGIAVLDLESVPDRAVGHLAAGNTLSLESPEIVGNKTLALLAGLGAGTQLFSIDTISPTVASLNFVIQDQSIVEKKSVLEMYFSENLYVVTGSEATPLGTDGLPITGVLVKTYYTMSGTGAVSSSTGNILRVESVSGSGAGPYIVVLDGIIERGSLELIVDPFSIIDFHGNPIGAPNSASVLWPGPLHNRNRLLVAPGGRTRLLMSGGFPPYTTVIDPYYSGIAQVASDGKSILGLGLGPYTVEVTESRDQTRFVNAEVVPPYGAEVSKSFDAYRDELDFQMVSFPFNLETWDGAGLSKILEDEAGELGVDYALFTFNGQDTYQPVLAQTTEVGPGYGFWMATRKNKSVKITGEGPLPEQVVGVDLHGGWNLIGNPFDQPLDSSQIYISTSGTRYSIRDLSQSETEHSIWFIDITKPRYVPLEKLDPFQGAWLYVNNPNGIEVIYFRGTEDPNYPIDFEPLPRSKGEAPKESSRRLASLLPPGRPGSFIGGSVSAVTPVASSSGGSGGGGGCLCR